MVRIRHNIFTSVVIHTVIIALALIAGRVMRNAVYRVPSDYISVSLFRDIKLTDSGRYLHSRYKPSELLSASNHQVQSQSHDKIIPGESLNNKDVLSAAAEESLQPLTAVAVAVGTSLEMPASHKIQSIEDTTSAVRSGNETITGRTEYRASVMPESGSQKGDIGHFYALIRAAIERAKVYPFIARKRKIEGTVIAEFTINSNGVPENIKVMKSSGFEILDSETKNIIRRAAPFPQIEGHIEIPITFSLKHY